MRTQFPPNSRFVFFAATLIVALTTSAPVFAQTPRPSSHQDRGVDATVKPGDDFFAYANGAWLNATTIPAGKARWGARDDINALVQRQLTQLLDDVRTAPAGSPARKVADFRAAWLNESAIESRGITPLKPLLDSIARLGDQSALVQFLGGWVRADVDPLNWGVYQSAHLIGLSVEPSIHGEKQYVAFLLQGGLGLGDRERYLSTDSSAQALRAKYAVYIARLLTLAGSDRADQRAAAVLALETAIAQRQATREATANDRDADTVWTHDDFIRRAPGINWHAFLAAAGLGGEVRVGAWQPGALIGVAELIGSQPLQVWQDYLRFHAINEYADLLPREFANAARRCEPQ